MVLGRRAREFRLPNPSVFGRQNSPGAVAQRSNEQGTHHGGLLTPRAGSRGWDVVDRLVVASGFLLGAKLAHSQDRRSSRFRQRLDGGNLLGGSDMRPRPVGTEGAHGRIF